MRHSFKLSTSVFREGNRFFIISLEDNILLRYPEIDLLVHKLITVQV